MRNLALLACLVAPAALAAPRLDNLVVKPNPAAFSGAKGPEVEVTLSVKRGKFDSGNCDAAIDLGDGSRPRTVEFGVAAARTIRYTYSKGGTFRVSAKGAGKTPCDGMHQASLVVKGAPAKKAEPKKKPEPKKKKPEPKKKGAEAPSS